MPRRMERAWPAAGAALLTSRPRDPGVKRAQHEPRPRFLENEECPHYWLSRVAANLIFGQRSMVSSRFTRDGARYTSAPE